MCVSAKVWIDVNPTGRCSMTVQSSAQVSSRSCWVRANSLITISYLYCHEHLVWLEWETQVGRNLKDLDPGSHYSCRASALWLTLTFDFTADENSPTGISQGSLYCPLLLGGYCGTINVYYIKCEKETSWNYSNVCCTSLLPIRIVHYPSVLQLNGVRLAATCNLFERVNQV